MDYISYNGNTCQLMMLLPNQFNKRTDFWIISITWLWLFPNRIPCSFHIFDKRVFGFVGIRSIFFFLSTILVMVMLEFQIKIVTWYYLTCCTSTFLTFSCGACLTNQVELHVVQLIVILFYLTALTDLILYYFYCIINQIGQNILFYIHYHHFLDPK